MRAHTTLRIGFRFGMMFAAAAGISFADADARADVAPSSAAPAGAEGSSTGTAVLKFENAKGLDTSIATPDLGFTKKVLGVEISATVKAVVKIDPVKGGGPLYSVAMPKGALVEASWTGDKKITLKAVNGATSDGLVTVRHALTPAIVAKVGVGGINAQIDYDGTKLLTLLQQKSGTNARFAYDSKAAKEFAPWGFAKVDTKLTAPALDGSELFTLGLTSFPEFVANNFDGEIGVRAVTDPTFSYTTSKVTLGGEALSASGGSTSIDAVDGDFIETTAAVEGQMAVAGSMKIQPFLHLTKVPILGAASIDIPYTAYAQSYTVPAQKVVFQAVTVHIPIPNVHAPEAGVDLGDVKAHGSAVKTVTIENSGEKAAKVSFKSSDPRFTVPGGDATIEPKGKYDLVVRFAPDDAGPAMSEITVLSNDPDSPAQTFKIGANGADVGGDKPGASASGGGPEGDSGCGCKTAGTSSVPSWAGLGLSALGMLALARRRRPR